MDSGFFAGCLFQVVTEEALIIVGYQSTNVTYFSGFKAIFNLLVQVPLLTQTFL